MKQIELTYSFLYSNKSVLAKFYFNGHLRSQYMHGKYHLTNPFTNNVWPMCIFMTSFSIMSFWLYQLPNDYCHLNLKFSMKKK